jgi:hypothetical protein
MTAKRIHLAAVLLAAWLSGLALPAGAASTGSCKPSTETFSENEILAKAEAFFGAVSKGLGQVVEKVFKEQGRPNAYITGEEASGAIGVGLRYGEGTLYPKACGARRVYWQGPSVGWDIGGNASKTFVLVYNLRDTDLIFQRFPGVEGTFYYVAGVGVNYQRSGDITLAPIRTGVGLRAGANIGYLHYTRKKSWLPF